MKTISFKKIKWAAAAAAGLLVWGVWQAQAVREPTPVSATALPGPVLALAVSRQGSLFYAGTPQGIWRSPDGSRWDRVFIPGFRGRTVQTVCAEDAAQGRVWAGAGSRIYWTKDGRSWRAGLKVSGSILCLAPDPADPGRLLAGTSHGLYESRDGGLTGRRMPGRFSRVRVAAILFDRSQPGSCWLLSERELFQSVDGGATWEQRGRRLPPAETDAEETSGEAEEGSEELLSSAPEKIAIHPDFPGLLFGLRGSRLLVYSEANGDWRRMNVDLPSGPLYELQGGEEGSFWLGTETGLRQVKLLEEQPVSGDEGQQADSAGPSIQQVHRMAIAYAEVGPEKVRRWRSLAKLRAFIPAFTLGLDQDRDTNVVSSTTGGVTRFTTGPEDTARSLDFGFTWDLGDFVWNPDQTSIDVRSRLTAQLRQDVLEEVTRLYFERKRLLAEFQAQPTQELALRRERELRIAELSAHLDALTGGGFSSQLD